MQFSIRFFSFPEVQTDPVTLADSGSSRFYLRKDKFVETFNGREKSKILEDLTEKDFVNLVYEIDPSTSCV